MYFFIYVKTKTISVAKNWHSYIAMACGSRAALVCILTTPFIVLLLAEVRDNRLYKLQQIGVSL